MTITNLALKSFRNRKTSILLTVLSIALSVALLLTIEKVRVQTKQSFTSTISATDLIVGSRTSQINLLLSSVFQMGTPTQAISYHSYQHFSDQPMVKWSIPFSLGDSHKSYKVIGTTEQFFEHYKYGERQSLNMRKGHWFAQPTHVVLGADVAKKLNYQVSDTVILSHGSGNSYLHHQHHPFTVVGVLAPTATPVDRSLFISLTGMDNLHQQQPHNAVPADPFAVLQGNDTAVNVQQNGTKSQDSKHQHLDHQHRLTDHSHEHVEALNKTSTSAALGTYPTNNISGFYLGLHERPSVLAMMQGINQYENEPLLAIMPGVALLELWSLLSIVEKALIAISLVVVVISLASMLIILLNSLNQRRREMAVLRAIGAKPRHIFSLLMVEAACMIVAGIVSGVLLVYGALVTLKPLVLDHFGVYLTANMLSPYECWLLLAIATTAMLISLVPGFQLYRYALTDGMSVRN
ncbi:ABC transporter permease [Thalassotalea ponticola]|uniref:ABC transporter permease n=1 Tax=Thalassotalea ponticola TaxID=1523392 RepID=UPI0025B49E62|nr:ABC transporter permease [Thalassotalea ponticola]MDN3651632.1 ABC transporter permease [Thalassotalea ponticola]